MARMPAFAPVAFRPFSRMRQTAAFNSSCAGSSGLTLIDSHLNACVYQRTVAGLTL